MALRAIMLKAKIDKKRSELEELKKKDADFATREAELETAIGEAQTEEEQQVVSEQVETFEAEKKGHNEKKDVLEKEIGDLEKDLENEEKQPPVRVKEAKGEKRAMSSRRKFFGMDAQERDAFLQMRR